eukprot:gene186-107_t
MAAPLSPWVRGRGGALNRSLSRAFLALVAVMLSVTLAGITKSSSCSLVAGASGKREKRGAHSSEIGADGSTISSLEGPGAAQRTLSEEKAAAGKQPQQQQGFGEILVPNKCKTLVASPFGPCSPFNHTMEYRPLGRTGLRVSALSYGAWLTFTDDGLHVDRAVEVLRTCIHQGMNFFDNAESYGAFYGESETIMGEALKRLFAEGWVRREDLVLTTKIFRGGDGISRALVAPALGTDSRTSDTEARRGLHTIYVRSTAGRDFWHSWRVQLDLSPERVLTTKIFRGGDGINDKGLSRKHVWEGLWWSLRRMQLEYVDVVYAHRFDPTTPLEETVRAFSWVVEKGYAIYWGTSEWTAEQISRARGIARELNLHPPVVEQPLYNMMFRHRVEVEYAPLYTSTGGGLGVTAYSPLGEGILAGRYLGKKVPEGSRGSTKEALLGREKQLQFAEKLQPFAAQLGVTMAQLALAWCLLNENVSSLITGASRPEQVVENVKALGLVGKLRELRSHKDAAGGAGGAKGAKGAAGTGEGVWDQLEQLMREFGFEPALDHSQKVVHKEFIPWRGEHN